MPYKNLEDALICQRRYDQSHRDKKKAYYIVHRDERIISDATYYSTHREQKDAAHAVYCAENPDRIAVIDKKHQAGRRALGFLPMNSWFPESEAHHLDPDHVVYIPQKLHHSIWHNVRTGKGMEQINALALQYARLSLDVTDDVLPFD